MILDLQHQRPTIKDERWKYTSLRGLDHFPFLTAKQSLVDVSIVPELPFKTSGRIVYVDGYYMPSLSVLPAGLTKSDVTCIDSKVTFENPIDCVFIATDAAKDCSINIEHPIQVGESSTVSLILRTVGLASEQYLSNIYHKIHVGKNSRVSLHVVQLQSDMAYHVEQIYADVDTASEINVHALSLGAKLSRTDVDVNYVGAHAQSKVYGIYHVSKNQHVDFHLNAEHHQPHCDTHQHVKGCVNGEARAVFNGRVSVPRHAIKSLSEQSHHGLLLSKRARIDAKPELEIDCDDVKCRHGATVGALRPDAVFYLMSRGIDESSAKSILELAHVMSLLDNIESPEIRSYAETLIRGAACLT